MRDPAPSDKFLFFQSPRIVEILLIPGTLIIVLGLLVYNRIGLSYALYLSPDSYRLAIAAVILVSCALTLILCNSHWAYEGNYTRWQSRPFKKFNADSQWMFALKVGVLFIGSMIFFNTFFTQALPHWLLLHTGQPEVGALVVQEKTEYGSRYHRVCVNIVVASSTEYQKGNLCLESGQLYAELEVGDTLIVEGKANWIGLLVDRPIAVRDGDSGLERSVGLIPRQLG